MTSVTDRRDIAARLVKAEYAAGHLIDVLQEFQRKQLTGVVRIEALSENGISRRSIVLRQGAIVYAGRSIPTPHEFVTELAKHAQIGILDTVLAFAAKRSSIQSVMRAMVEIGVLQWPEIAAATQQHAIAVLKELLPIAGRVTFESGLSPFDLQDGLAESGSILEALQSADVSTDRGQETEPPESEDSPKVRPVILSVEDSPIARALIERALTLEQDCETLFCSRAAEALQILGRRADISMVLLDLTLPDIDGLSFCRLLRGLKQYKDLPIVMLTARDGVLDRMRGRLAGTTHYLTKPVNPTELAAIVTQYAT